MVSAQTPPRSQDERGVGDAATPYRDAKGFMLTMTDNAATAVRLISANSGLEPDPGLRITVGAPSDDGTPLEIGIAAEPGPNDETVEEGGARVYLEELVAPALDDKVLDAEIEGDQVRFALREALSAGSDGNAPGV